MPARYAKTALGRSEIQSRTHALSRTARTLLLILDATRTGEVWVSMVQGATPADLLALLDAGLVAPVDEAAQAPAVPTAPATASTPSAAPASPDTEPFASTQADPAAEQALGRAVGVPATATTMAFGSLSYSELNTRLNALVKAHLGLIKGYRFTLDIERATDVIELQRVAMRLVAEVESARGAPAVADVRRALGL